MIDLYDDYVAPYINSQASDDNPAGTSQSIPTATGGFASQASQFLGKLLDYNLQRDQQKYQQTLIEQGRMVGSPMAWPMLNGAAMQPGTMHPALKAGLVVAGLAIAFVAVKKLA